MRLVPFASEEEAGIGAANYIVERIKDFNPTADRPFVLGLPTGGTPVRCYRELVKLHKAGKISFKHVITFNMDEYVGLPRDHEQSYWTFMHENLFNHIDIPKENVHILDGNAPDLAAECAKYEKQIKE